MIGGVRGRVLALAVVIVSLLGFFASAATTRAGGGTGGRVLTFGAAISLTGATAQEGKLTLNGYQLWARTVNAHGGLNVGGVRYQIAVKYYDDGSVPARSAQLAERLIRSDKVNFLLGPYGSSATLADEVVAERNRVPMVGSAASTAVYSRHYRYIFGVDSLAPEYARVMLRAALSVPSPPRTVAIIYAGSAFSREVAPAARAYALARGLKVVFYREYPSGTTNFTGILSQLKTAGPGHSMPNMVLGSAVSAESIAAMQEARRLGINPKLFAFTIGPATPGFIRALGPAANDVISSAQWTVQERYTGSDVFRTPANYARMYESVYGQIPAYQAAEATASGLAFQFAIERAGSINRQQVRDRLARLNIRTFFGPIRPDASGANSSKPMSAVQIQHGHLETVYPPSVANARMIYPTPPFGHRF
jgi:branched-chain amino acid transport system substrate-binding protein